MERRRFIKTAGLGAVAAAGAATSFPKAAISQGRIEWRMVTGWPKGLPGLHTGAERFAQRVGDMSGGRLTIKVFAAGELVPAFGGWDAVVSGSAEMAHDAPYYHISKAVGAAFFSAVPFGLTATETSAWINFGGGQEVWDKLYAPFGLMALHGGSTGVQMGGWFRKEIKSVDDLKGLKFRMPGQGGQVLTKLGATVVNLPGGEIFPALQSGALDGTEWVGPYNDLALGFYKVAPFYYWPGFHEPGTTLQVMMSKAKFEALPKDLQAIIRSAAAAEMDVMTSEFNGKSGPALNELITKHRVQLRQFPRDVLIAFGTASGEVMQDVLDKADPNSKAVAVSFLKFRKEIMAYSRISDLAYMQARLLSFKYPG